MVDLSVFTATYPPPDRAIGVTDWAAVEQSVGRSLPSDYRFIVENYPDGFFDDNVHVYDTGDDRAHGIVGARPEMVKSLADCRSWVADFDKKWVDEDGQRSPIDLTSDPLPYIPWGNTQNGEYCFWLTDSENPDEWAAVATDLRGNWWRNNGGVAQLILDLGAGVYEPLGWTERHPSPNFKAN